LEQLDSNVQKQDIQELMGRLIYIPMSKKRQRVLYQKKCRIKKINVIKQESKEGKCDEKELPLCEKK
jgi:hypothetical protein